MSIYCQLHHTSNFIPSGASAAFLNMAAGTFSLPIFIFTLMTKNVLKPSNSYVQVIVTAKNLYNFH